MAQQCYTARAHKAPRSPEPTAQNHAVSFHPSMGHRPHAATPARVTLVLPGLVWPGSGISSPLQRLNLPALAMLLGRGKPQAAPASPWSHWLPAQFGVETLPWASLRLAGESTLPAPGDAGLLCADPVSLAFASDALLLRGPREVALDAAEMAALLASLTAEFGELGEWLAASPTRFYLRPNVPANVRFHPLQEVLGRPVALFAAEGAGAREWNRIANDIQVMLHNHPVNRARAERGQLCANALWFWGSAQDTPAAWQPPASHLCSRDPLLRGLAQASGCTLVDTPARIGAGLPGHTWVHDPRLQEAAQDGDLDAWLDALDDIEHRILQVLELGWRDGRIDEIRLLAPSDRQTLSARLTTTARWAFWRKPLPANAIAAMLQDAPPPRRQPGAER